VVEGKGEWRKAKEEKLGVDGEVQVETSAERSAVSQEKQRRKRRRERRTYTGSKR
jgi:hypothetical protein